MAEGAVTKSIRDKFVQRASINADPFKLSTGQSVVIDLHPFVNNRSIQVNSLVGTLTMTLSWDGVTFSNSSTPTAGITAITPSARYVKLTMSSGGSDAASGLVAGSLR